MAKQTRQTYRLPNGAKSALPIYYRNKIYTEDEREKLWIQKLDKEERWVCGEKIDISKSEETYENVRKFYRKKNKELGYGDDKTWNEENYKKKLERLRKHKQDAIDRIKNKGV